MAKVDKQQQVQALLKQAEDGARAVFESENYRNYLSTMSKFHNYSFRNTLLIYMQKPEASYVAGYVAWQKNFNRQVQKGEKGIQIVGYTPKNVNQEQEKRDEQGNPVIGADGKPETETVTRKIPYFTPVYVYDVSQTEGEPLPRLVNELDGSVEAYNDLMTALREVSPFPIVFEDIKGGVNGYCSPAEQKIAVRQGMSEAQTVKTAIHEITHADLHAPEIDADLENRKDRRTKEVEAESTAFIVCSHYGIDTSDYSFGYLASWSSTKELTELQSSLDTIQKQANELIDRIDNRLAELQKDRPLEIANEAIDVRTAVAEQIVDFLEKHDPAFGYAEGVEGWENREQVVATVTADLETGEYHLSNCPKLTLAIQQEAERIEQRIKEVRKDYPAPAERSFSIYQLNATGRKYRFESLEVFGTDERPTLSMYDKVYEGKLPPTATLDNIFEQFNIERPADFTGHSLSVSDIIAIKDDGIISAYYVDRIGFESLPEFAQEIEDKQQEINVADFERQAETKNPSFRRLFRDPEAVIEAGINADGELYFGGEGSGYNLPDTPENRRYIEADIKRYTGKDVSLGNPPQKEIVGVATYATGDRQEFTDKAAFIATVKEELPYRSTTGFQYQVLTNDAETRKAIDDLAYNEYGEINPRPIEDYKEAPADFTHFYYDTKYLFTVSGDREAQAVYDNLCSDVKNMGYFWSDGGKAYKSDQREAPISDRSDADKTKTAYVEYTPELYRQHVSQLEKLYDDINPQPVEHTVVNVDRLLAEAQKTPDYFKVKSAITGLPIDENGYVSITALMDKTRGTDAYDAINKIFEEQQRRANETLDSIKFDNDIDLDMEKTREQLGFKDAAQPQTAADIFKAARDKAARINGDADRQQPEQQQKKDRNTERGE